MTDYGYALALAKTQIEDRNQRIMELERLIDESHRMIVDEDTGRRWKELYQEAKQQLADERHDHGTTKRTLAEVIDKRWKLQMALNAYKPAPEAMAEEIKRADVRKPFLCSMTTQKEREEENHMHGQMIGDEAYVEALEEKLAAAQQEIDVLRQGIQDQLAAVNDEKAEAVREVARERMLNQCAMEELADVNSRMLRLDVQIDDEKTSHGVTKQLLDREMLKCEELARQLAEWNESIDETLQRWRDLYEVTNQALHTTQDCLVKANDERLSLQEQIRELKQEVVNEEKPKDNDLNPLTPESIAQYAAAGAVVVWRSWRKNMLKQFRQVATERMRWDTLPQQDKELDQHICEDVVTHFANWLIGQMDA